MLQVYPHPSPERIAACNAHTGHCTLCKRCSCAQQPPCGDSPLMQTSHCRQYCHLSSSSRALVSGAAWPFTWYVSPFAATEDRSARSLFPGSCSSRLRWDALRRVSLCRTGVWTGTTPARSSTQVRQVQLQLICKDSSRTHRLNSELSDTGHPANPHATIIRGLLGRRCCGPN